MRHPIYHNPRPGEHDTLQFVDLRGAKKRSLFGDFLPRTLALFTLYALAFYGLVSLVPDEPLRALDRWTSVEGNQIKLAVWIGIVSTLSTLSYLIFWRKK